MRVKDVDGLPMPSATVITRPSGFSRTSTNSVKTARPPATTRAVPSMTPPAGRLHCSSIVVSPVHRLPAAGGEGEVVDARGRCVGGEGGRGERQGERPGDGAWRSIE